MQKEELLLIYDYETTGPDPKTALPVQIAATLHRAGAKPVIVMNMLCNPGCEISEGASEVHGIYAKDVVSAPHHSVATYMLGNYVENLALSHSVIIGGQNHITYDNQIAERTNWPEVGDYPQLDLLTLARRTEPTLPNHKLSTLYMHRTGKELTGAHDASADVLGVGEILSTYLEEFDNSYMKMANLCSIPQAWTIIPIGKHKGKQVSMLQKGWFEYMCKHTSIHKENADFAETLKVHFNYLWQIHVGE